MASDELTKPSVPIAYGLLTIQLAEERGVAREDLLAGSGVDAEDLAKPDGRISLLQWGKLIHRGLELTGEPGLGYEFGLRNNLAAHGLFGYGLISNPTAREALEFAAKYVPLCTLAFGVEILSDHSHAVIDVKDRIPFGPIRQYSVDMYLVSMAHTINQCLAPDVPKLELWFDYPEPEYYRRYRDRLPTTRFSMGVNQVRIPAEYAERRIDTANTVTARLISSQCERELSKLGVREDFLARARALLAQQEGTYRSQEDLAEHMCMSSRTLKRKLRQHGTSYKQLLDDARRRDSVQLLKDPTLTLETIAARVGYDDPANFTRAFRRWTGQTPGRYRSRLNIATMSSRRPRNKSESRT